MNKETQKKIVDRLYEKMHVNPVERIGRLVHSFCFDSPEIGVLDQYYQALMDKKPESVNIEDVKPASAKVLFQLLVIQGLIQEAESLITTKKAISESISALVNADIDGVKGIEHSIVVSGADSQDQSRLLIRTTEGLEFDLSIPLEGLYLDIKLEHKERHSYAFIMDPEVLARQVLNLLKGNFVEAVRDCIRYLRSGTYHLGIFQPAERVSE